MRRRLRVRDAGGSAAEAVVGAIADFDDRECATIERDHVEFAAAGAEVLLQDPVAGALEMPRRGGFGRAADLEVRRAAHDGGTALIGGGSRLGRPFTTWAQSSSRRTRPWSSIASRPVSPGSGVEPPLRRRRSSPIIRNAS